MRQVGFLVTTLVALGLSSLVFSLALRFQVRLTPISSRVSRWLDHHVPQVPTATHGPLERLRRLLVRAQVPVSPWFFLFISIWCGILGSRAAAVLENRPLMVSLFITCALLPLTWLRHRIVTTRMRVMRALGPALVQLTKVADVRGHPLPALQDAVPTMEEPLRGEFQRVLQAYSSSAGLGDELRAAATRLGNDPYVVQLAEMVDLCIRTGASFSEALFRLLTRYRYTEELRAEEQTHMKGYIWLTWVFYIGSLLPLPYWLLHDPTTLPTFQTPAAKWLLLWVFLSGLCIVVLPTLFAVEEV